MLQKSFTILLLACSLGCKDGPKIKVCISDPKNGGLQCVEKDGQTRSFLPYSDSDNYVATSPDDFEELVRFCKLKDSKESSDGFSELETSEIARGPK